jgi:hypothetical protein
MSAATITITEAAMIARARWRTIIRQPLARIVHDFDTMPPQNVGLCISCPQRGAHIDSSPADTKGITHDLQPGQGRLLPEAFRNLAQPRLPLHGES